MSLKINEETITISISIKNYKRLMIMKKDLIFANFDNPKRRKRIFFNDIIEKLLNDTGN